MTCPRPNEDAADADSNVAVVELGAPLGEPVGESAELIHPTEITDPWKLLGE